MTTGLFDDPRNLEAGNNGDYMQTVDGVATWGPRTDALDTVIVTVTKGVPMLMFDADSSPVTTEVPS